MKPLTPSEEKFIALATLVGLRRSVEILEGMKRGSRRNPQPVYPPALDWEDMPQGKGKSSKA